MKSDMEGKCLVDFGELKRKTTEALTSPHHLTYLAWLSPLEELLDSTKYELENVLKNAME